MNHCPPLADDEWPSEIEHMRNGFSGSLNVYRVMAHHPALLRAWASFRMHVVEENALGSERTEIAILRTGFRMQAAYEWNHHVCRARLCGINDARIDSIRGPIGSMATQDAVIARAVDALVDERKLSETIRSELQALVRKEGVFDLIATVGLYSILGYIVRTFPTPLDADIADQLKGSRLLWNHR